MDEKFGCELITKKGKILKFDDPICLIRFLRSGEVSKNGIRQLLVVNFEKKGELLPVEKASFLIADYVVSPMGSKVAAFGSKDAAVKFMTGRAGVIKTWAELEKTLP